MPPKTEKKEKLNETRGSSSNSGSAAAGGGRNRSSSSGGGAEGVQRGHGTAGSPASHNSCGGTTTRATTRNDHRDRGQQHQQQPRQRFHHSSPSSSSSLHGSRGRVTTTTTTTTTSSRRSADTRAATAAAKTSNAHQFPLISSATHTFVITRSTGNYNRGARRQQTAAASNTSPSSPSSSLPQQPRRSFQGIDASVSWEAVRLVNYHCYLQPLTTNSSNRIHGRTASESAVTACPICLDDATSMACPRITKCGHVFCLPCLMHHIHSRPNNRNNSNQRCPCCAADLHLDDVKPCRVVVHPSTTHSHPKQQHLPPVLRFVKLHRVKTCSAPYLPIPFSSSSSSGNQKRSHGSGLPLQGDDDEWYSKFAYVDTELVLRELQEHLDQLLSRQESIRDEQQEQRRRRTKQRQMQQRQPHPQGSRLTTAAVVVDDDTIEAEQLEVLSNKWAIQFVQNEIDNLQHEKMDEDRMRDEFDQPAYGMRQPLCPSLFFEANGDGGDDEGTEWGGGTTYLESTEDEYVFYQAEDGRLCFLSPYNVKCLQHEFSTCKPPPTRPVVDDDASSNDPCASRRPSSSVRASPLPDVVQGPLVDVERVQLTPIVRQRLRFLSHLPLYTELCFVEINLGRILSKDTKKVFAKEFYARQQQRAAKLRAEQRERDRDRRLELQRIQDLKDRFQSIDPTDPFFHSFTSPVETELNMTSEAFGPRLQQDGRGNGGPTAAVASDDPSLIPHDQEPPSSSSADVAAAHRIPALSFSQMVRRGGEGAVGDGSPSIEDFPALGAVEPSSQRPSPPPPRPWGDRSALKQLSATRSSLQGAPSTTSIDASPAAMPSTKKKGPKIVLLSTGGPRGGA